MLAREQHRFAELRAAWHAQADKVRQLDLLLEQPVFAESAMSQAVGGCANHSHPYRGRQQPAGAASECSSPARPRAIEFHADLTSTLARVRELVTMIHLAKYTGAPASRAEELVMQIATSIEGLSEVAAWQGAETAARSLRIQFSVAEFANSVFRQRAECGERLPRK